MISVVIATHNNDMALVATLASLVPGAADGLVVEAIVADAGSTDRTEQVADAAGCRFLTGVGPEGQRLNAAARLAKAPWLFFVRPGLSLDAAWIVETRRFLDIVTRNGETETRVAVLRAGVDGFGARATLAEWRARAAVRLGLASPGALLVSSRRFRALGGFPARDDPGGAFLRAAGLGSTAVLRPRAVAVSLAGIAIAGGASR